ncbi:hydrogenase maturation nickel metallochaperone HypA [Rhodoferax lacus]|uniref:Hydrogenase maturation factor HypA n=1 Tax=Rhodoferax lacus TaxID=2184758 RepID=A0A3E1R6H5_9BURK|nr:hydrogenase maturation nickel metallochaperone HypA [Rhodoferax lacus]RFO94907.1 hydrogenase maturation nickel metallochaperone HypA [Rhodoferax lacus]
MHEASLAGGILQVVEDTARREGFARVTVLRLEAGQLAGVEARALRFALEALAPGTCLAGARVEIDEPAGQAWCMACSTSVALLRRGDACPQCGGYQLQPTGGTELRIVDMLVEDDPAPAPEAAHALANPFITE